MRPRRVIRFVSIAVLALPVATGASAHVSRNPATLFSVAARNDVARRQEVLVIRRPGDGLEPMPDGELRGADARTAELLSRFGLVRWRALGHGGAAARARRAPDAWLALTSGRADFDAAAAARALTAAGVVAAAAPNLTLQLAMTLPNDSDDSLQYALGSTSGGGVRLTEAWDLARGDTSTLIAVIDVGVDRTHPDLASQIWRNRGEMPANGLDDDGNGFADDVNGWDFGDGDNDPNPDPLYDPSGIDIGFHGTFVAGIASAATDNAEGIAGAAWHCRIMPLKVADSTGTITLEATAAAIRYAWGNGARVLNLSLGTADTTARAFFQAVVDSATDRNVLCVAAAGNAGTADPNFPAACTRVLSVGATDLTGTRASFSNYGPWVSVAAPGGSIWSSIAQNYEYDVFTGLIYSILFGWDGTSPYMYGDGTSFSSPLAAGVAALVRSRWPSLTPDQVRQHVIDTGDAVAFDEPIGPMLDAYRAVSTPVLEAPLARTAAPAAAWPNPFRAMTVVRFALLSPARVWVQIVDPSGRRVRTLEGGAFSAGVHEVAWDGRDARGTLAAPGVYFVRLETGETIRTLRLAKVE